MIKSYERISGRNTSCFKDRIDAFRKRIRFDVYYIITFDKNFSHAVILDSNIEIKKNPVEIADGDLLIKYMLESRKVVYSNGDDYSGSGHLYEHFCGDLKREVYIPIFSHLDTSVKTIGCIYFGAYKAKLENLSNKKFENYEDLIRSFSILDYYFNEIYEKYSYRNKFLSFVNIVSEIYKNQYHRVNHPYNVAYYSLCVADELNFSDDQKFQLYISAILHDIGTLLIPQDIINKNGKLSREEYEIVKKHTVYGYNIIEELNDSMEIFTNMEDAIKYHHERYDGKGYPDGLSGKQIPLFSRIIAIADAVDAMLSERNYKNSMSLDKVICELSANKSKQFDPALADTMINILIRQKNDIDESLGPVTWGTLVLSTKTESLDFQGNLMKRVTGFEFVSNELEIIKQKKLKPTEIEKLALIVEKNNQFYEYDILPAKITSSKVYIQDIHSHAKNQYFSLYWNLEGKIIDNEEHTADIAVIKIGGNLITFYCLEKNDLPLKKLYVLKVVFEDGEILEISGENMRKYENESRIYYDFAFVNISENVREKIFRQIYKKQIEIQQFVWRTSYMTQ